MALEDLEKQLYRQAAVKRESAGKELRKSKTEKIPLSPLKEKWVEEEKSEESGEKQFVVVSKISRYGKILFWGLLGVLVIAGGIAGFYLYKYFTAKDVNLALEAPEAILSGVPFELAVDLTNESNDILLDAKLSINLPEKTTLTGDNFEKRIIVKDLGDLGVGTSLQEKFSILALGEEQAIKRFNASLSYSLKSTMGTRFEKTKGIEVSVREPGIKLDLITPQKVLNNEDFEIEVRYQNVSDVDFSGFELELTYPSNFTYKKSNISASVGNRIWNLGALSKNSEGSFTINGSIVGPELSFFEIKISAGAFFLGQKYLISEKAANLNIAASPLSLNIQVNDRVSDFIAGPGDSLTYRLNYRNNTDVGLSDVIVKARLTGEMFDFSTLETNAFFSSLDNTIIWNAANSPELRLLKAGASGFLEFQLKLKSNYPTKRLSDKNFVLKVQAEINSPTVPYYVVSERTIGLANFETKIMGKITVDAQAFFKEASGVGSGIINKGAWPPKVNQPTNYTVHWVIANYATDIRDIEIKAFLQSGVRWTGQVKSNIETQPEYNERTQEVVWRINKIQANKGVVGAPVEAVFQIEAVPDITQVNYYMPLMSQTFIKAFDEFVNMELNNSDEPLTTQLTDDLSVDPKEGTVMP